MFDAADVDNRVRVRGSGPVAFGTFTFDASSDGSVLIVPRTVLGRDGRGRAWLTTVTGRRGDRTPPAAPARGTPARPRRDPLAGRQPAGPRWERAVAEAVAAIKAGGLRKVVLARDVFATADEPIDARVLLRRLADRYPDCFTFACDGMIGATPELLVRRAGGGQRPRARRNAAARGRPGTGRGPRRGTAGLGEEQRRARLRGHSIREGLGPLCKTWTSRPGRPF